MNVSARGFDQVGGLIGDAASAVSKNSSVSGRGSGGSVVGSLIVDDKEDILTASIIDSEANVEVSGSGARVAGLVGEADAKHQRCEATSRKTSAAATPRAKNTPS